MPSLLSRLESPRPTVSDISAALAQIRGQIAAASREQPQIENRRAALREEIGRVEEQLRANHRAMEECSRESARLHQMPGLNT